MHIGTLIGPPSFPQPEYPTLLQLIACVKRKLPRVVSPVVKIHKKSSLGDNVDTGVGDRALSVPSPLEGPLSGSFNIPRRPAN